MQRILRNITLNSDFLCFILFPHLCSDFLTKGNWGQQPWTLYPSSLPILRTFPFSLPPSPCGLLQVVNSRGQGRPLRPSFVTCGPLALTWQLEFIILLCLWFMSVITPGQCECTVQVQTGQETATVEWLRSIFCPLPVRWKYNFSNLGMNMGHTVLRSPGSVRHFSTSIVRIEFWMYKKRRNILGNICLNWVVSGFFQHSERPSDEAVVLPSSPAPRHY